MGPRRRKWRRRAAKAALAALALALLWLQGSGAGEELLAAALAWGEGRGAIGGLGGEIRDPGVGIGGPGVGNGDHGGGIRDPGVGIGGPGGEIRDPGVETGGPAVKTGSPHAPPGCTGLLSGGSGILPAAPWGSPRTPKVLLAPAPCPSPAPFLLTLVPSAPSHRQRRRAVRDTWGGPWGSNRGGTGALPARTVFVLGRPEDPRGQREVLAEWRRHGDVLQGDFTDTYGNLTRKTVLLLRWARACCGAVPFILKADDDVFINTPALSAFLAAWPPPVPPLYVGRVHWAVRPNRDPRSRHHVPVGLFGARRFPRYCSGTAYVLSGRAAGAVLAAGRRLPVVLPEDVWVGAAAAAAGVAARHSARFGGAAGPPAERCCLRGALFSAHRLAPEGLRSLWAELGSGCAAAPGLLRCRLGGALRAWGWGWGGGGEGVQEGE
ncbi:beta-1,3-galactosyltransferase 4 [Taeniopygia guttata]|uniref:beta-1,3-galactosyltransferase 4 n=1 Tax=Taeniopygia guttata TaxID=59729 RepID=UPI003BB92D55